MGRSLAAYIVMKTRTMWYWSFFLAGFSLVGAVSSAHAGIASIGDVSPTDASTWNNSTEGYIGNTYGGTVTVDGGSGLLSGYGVIASESGASGSVSVSGAGSTWTNTYYMFVGLDGSGTLSIFGGGAVSTDRAYVGFEDAGNGLAVVSGAGSSWTCTSYLYIGYMASGTLSISGGGAVGNDYAFIARQIGSSGSVGVSGANSTWTNTNDLLVGVSGNGTLSISNGGTVKNVFGYIGYGDTASNAATGFVTVSGAGSTWTNSDELYIGFYGNGSGTLSISNGGAVSNTNSFIGVNSGSFGVVAVSGAGSTWTNSGTFTMIGYSGNGTLSITAGGAVTSGYAFISDDTTSSGLVTVSGSGSTWTNAYDAYIGVYGGGTLSISGGGAVTNVLGLIGCDSAATGLVSVADSGSKWTNSSDLYVGFSGGGTLSIANGGAVANPYGYIGYDTASTGVVTLSGAGSTWTNGNDLIVGQYGAGVVTQTGGTNIVVGTLSLGYESSASGTYNLNGGVLAIKALSAGYGSAAFNFGGGTIQATGSLSTSLPMTLTGIGGNAAVDTQNYSCTLSGVLSGTETTGGLMKAGAGTLTLYGDNTYAGVTIVKAGTLKLVGTDLTAPGAWNPVLNKGGADVQAGKLVFDYATNGGTSPGAAIQTILKASYDTSKFAGGKIYSSTAGTTTYGLGWVDDGNAVTVKIAVYGDADLSGVVGASDLSTVLTNFGLAGTWSTGDFDYSGIVGASDLSAVLTNFGQTLPSSLDVSPYHLDADAIRALTAAGITVVPEPNTLALLTMGLVGLLAYVWQKRK
jgi:fibronectin-binding autotransporter adhesin